MFHVKHFVVFQGGRFESLSDRVYFRSMTEISRLPVAEALEATLAHWNYCFHFNFIILFNPLLANASVISRASMTEVPEYTSVQCSKFRDYPVAEALEATFSAKSHLLIFISQLFFL